ncbi:MAG: heme-binding protein [Alphaproteobacteria bacterium]|nr:heme-binding protein [Alphaproteobacteria bacterium]
MLHTAVIALIIFIGSIVLWSLWGVFGSRVEQAEYTVIKKTNDYEIREYPAHIVAQTTVQNATSNREGMSTGFTIVARYIFGNNTKKESIAMTAPVIVQKEIEKKVSENIAMTAPVFISNEGDSQIISFGMPRSYTLATLPTPNDPRVKIVEVPIKKYAVMQFSWYRTDARITSKQETLLSMLARDGIITQGNAAYAGYNAPWTPPWMTRNEVLVEIK